MSQQQQFRNIVYLSDRSGTGVWRKIWPLNQINCVAQGLGIQADYSQTPILDQNYYRGVNSITIQRWISDQQAKLVTSFFKPLMDANGGYVVYEIDDLMFDGTLLNESKRTLIEEKYGKNLHANSIPLFNRGRGAFEGIKVQTNIKDMLLASDFVTVTTDFLKEVYHDIYDVPMENLIAVPNLLPKYLFGDRYDPEKKLKQFGLNKAKPRIGIVSSLSHFNVDNVRMTKAGLACREKEMPDKTKKWVDELGAEVNVEDTERITDDFDEIAQLVRDTVDDFQWVCFGYCPPQIKDLVEKRKIECHGGVPIMNYPSMLENLHLQAIIAPIKKMLFNFSKSPIKYLESCAIGVPLFATNCLPYNRVMPKDQLFDSAEDLKTKLLKLKFESSGAYKKIIERQWNYLNSPTKEGDFQLQNYWLEGNLGIHIDLFKLRSKGIKVSLSGFVEQYNKRKQADAKDTMFQNDSIKITK